MRERALADANARYARRRLHLTKWLDGGLTLDGLLDPEGGAILRTATHVHGPRWWAPHGPGGGLYTGPGGGLYTGPGGGLYTGPGGGLHTGPCSEAYDSIQPPLDVLLEYLTSIGMGHVARLLGGR